MTEYLAAVLAVDVLADGDASRLYERIVKKDQLATHLFGYVGLFGNPFEVRDPTMAQIMAYYHGAPNPNRILKAVDQEVDRLVSKGISDDELERVRNSWLSSYFQRADNFMQRGLTLATLEQQRKKPELLNDLPAALIKVTPADIRAAAETWLQPATRAVLDIQPGGAK